MAALPQLPPQQAEQFYALAFEVDAEAKLLALQEELRTHSYRPGRSILFTTAGPKPREVFAADFRDRIGQTTFSCPTRSAPSSRSSSTTPLPAARIRARSRLATG